MHPAAHDNQDTDQFDHDENIDDDELDNEVNEQDTKDHSMSKSMAENNDEFDGLADEPESRDKIIRKELDKYLTNHWIGNYIQLFIAFMSVFSSIAFMIMT